MSPATSPRYQKNWKLLLLTNNQLTEIPDDVFDGLTALGQLYLDGNGLTTLKDSSDNVIFADSIKLTELFLDNNQLSSLPDDVFDGLTKLNWLTLHKNPFATLPDGVFRRANKTGKADAARRHAPSDIIGKDCAQSCQDGGTQRRAL